MIRDCKLGKNIRIPHPDWVNLYECAIGDNTFIAAGCEVPRETPIENMVAVDETLRELAPL